ncbi:MAG: cytidine deaminase [Wenzhouxiangella sp.]
MTSIEDDLMATLRTCRDNAYAPYSGHPVAAVIEAGSGRRYGGANVEAAHFKSLCAEASAIATMVGAGERDIRTVYILGPGNRPCPPCGDCRQRIREFSGPEVRIVMLDDRGDVLATRTIDELLPDSFGPENLKD